MAIKRAKRREWVSAAERVHNRRNALRRRRERRYLMHIGAVLVVALAAAVVPIAAVLMIG